MTDNDVTRMTNTTDQACPASPATIQPAATTGIISATASSDNSTVLTPAGDG
jgi:hypothetical protein